MSRNGELAMLGAFFLHARLQALPGNPLNAVSDQTIANAFDLAERFLAVAEVREAAAEAKHEEARKAEHDKAMGIST